ncbi:MAG TPA: lasso peptide biosynthesis B2 protein [Acidimicrobiales bacterium]|nr:lasso peptide biosynthesis B2 protein [Acidimicrobiales bacterium]
MPISDRLAQFPGAKDALRFLGQLRCPTRTSAVRAVLDGVLVTLTLKRKGVRPLLATAGAKSASHDLQRSMQVSAAVDAGLALLPVAPTCLRRSVTLIRELDRLGLAAALHVGVRNVGQQPEAHAWVQVGDVVVNDDPEVTEEYVELAAGDLQRLLPLLG